MANVELTVKQGIALAESKHSDIVVFAGSYGAAKTAAMILWELTLQSEQPHQGLLVRSTYPEINDTLLPAFKDWAPADDYKLKSSPPPVARLRNGGTILFKHVQDYAKDLKGLNVGSIGIDQGEDISEDAFNALLGRLRQVNSPRKVFVTVNCNGHDYWWRMARKDAQVIVPPIMESFEDEPGKPYITRGGVYRKEMEVKVRDKIQKVRITLIEATAEENPHLPDDFLARELAMWGDKMVRRLYYLSWEESSSLVFSHFDREIHLIPDQYPVPQGYFTAGLDHGQVAPTSMHLWNTIWHPKIDKPLDPIMDALHIIGPEYYQGDRTIGEHAREIIELFSPCVPWDNQPVLPIYSDPMIFEPIHEDKGARYSDSEQYMYYGLHTKWALAPARSRRLQNKVSSFRELLTVDPTRPHLVTGKLGSPRAYLWDSDEMLIDELESLKTKDIRNLVRGILTEDKLEKTPDHAIDDVCYCGMSNPLPSMIQKVVSSADLKRHYKSRGQSPRIHQSPWVA